MGTSSWGVVSFNLTLPWESVAGPLAVLSRGRSAMTRALQVYAEWQPRVAAGVALGEDVYSLVEKLLPAFESPSLDIFTTLHESLPLVYSATQHVATISPTLSSSNGFVRFQEALQLAMSYYPSSVDSLSDALSVHVAQGVKGLLTGEMVPVVQEILGTVRKSLPSFSFDGIQSSLMEFKAGFMNKEFVSNLVSSVDAANSTGWQTCLLNISSSIQFDQLAGLKVAVSDAITSLETQLQSAEAASAAAIEQVLTQVSQLYEAVSMGEVGLAEAFNRVSAASSLPDMLSVVLLR